MQAQALFRIAGTRELKEYSDVPLEMTWRVSSPETSKRGAFVCKDIKYGEQLGDLKKIAYFLRQVQQLQVPALVLHRRKSADQFADSRAVDVVHVSEIQKNHFPLIFQQSSDGLSKQRAAVSESDLAAQIDNGDLSGIAMRRM